MQNGNKPSELMVRSRYRNKSECESRQQGYPAVEKNHGQIQIVFEYLPAVKAIADRLGGILPPNLILEDLIRAGVLGLIQAVDSFDLYNGAFRKYAEYRIRGAILDFLRERQFASRDPITHQILSNLSAVEGFDRSTRVAGLGIGLHGHGGQLSLSSLHRPIEEEPGRHARVISLQTVSKAAGPSRHDE